MSESENQSWMDTETHVWDRGYDECRAFAAKEVRP